MSYSAEHADAYADIAEAGFAITFTRDVASYDETTDVNTVGSISSYTGQALRMPGDRRQYEALGLTQKDPITLLYSTSSYGADLPPLGARTSTPALGGGTYTVKAIDRIAPDGNDAIIAYLVLAR